ncbi:MAG: TetR family transcriptional regulator [Pontiellaceae bacterium]|nr:TetR family transcriptional regulator [Pontiellaceae bacterium]MBN2785813.1 TetR family transcriptional regulator [Pontiellaceae bacterium]
MARRTKEEAAETRKQILDAALDVFSRKGYSRTTFVDIAQQLDLTKGAVYWHFKSKTDLLVTLIEETLTRKCMRVDRPDGLVESLESVRACYVESARKVLADPALRKFEFFINFQIEWSEELMSEVRARLAEMGEDPFLRYSSAISRLQELGVVDASLDAEKLGSLLMATWVGLMRWMMIGKISEEELIYRLEYGFDSLFKDIAKKEQVV